jgi:hypothetical protein
MYISNLTNKDAKSLLRKFWGISDTLHYEIDQLPFDQFAVKYKYLVDVIDRISLLEGHLVTVNISNLVDKARSKYGELFDNNFSEVSAEKLCA